MSTRSEIEAVAFAEGRAAERADVVAELRRKAREDGDEDFATTTEVWADVLEAGAHEGAAERERQAEIEAEIEAEARRAAARAPDPNQGVLFQGPVVS
jgi:hypothetical protein